MITIERDAKSIKELERLQERTRKYMRDPDLKIAARNLQNEEVYLMCKALKHHGINYRDEQEIREQLIVVRWNNPICSCCKEKHVKLKHCGKCFLIFYCNKSCQTADWPNHRLECCNVDASMNDLYEPVLSNPLINQLVKISEFK